MVRVRIRTRSGKDVTQDVDGDLTIWDLKYTFESVVEIEPEKQRMIHNGKLCHDEETVESLDLQDDDVIWIEGSSQSAPAAVSTGDSSEPTLPSTGSAIGNSRIPAPPTRDPPQLHQLNLFGTPSSTAPPASGATSATNPLFSSFGQFQQNPSSLNPFFNLNPTPSSGSQQQPNPFGALGGFGGMGGTGDQPFDMRQLMQNPAMRSMMESMTNNPEVFRNLFNSSPAFQQILQDNPQLRHMLNDDQLFQTAMRAAQDPEYYNEMLRSNDRALQNIESLPGGFSALSKMYNQIQKPMEDAMDDMYRQRNGRPRTVLSRLDTSRSTPTRDQMPNPWSQGGRAPPVPRPSRRERIEMEDEKASVAVEPDEIPRRRDPHLVSRVMNDEEQKSAIRDVLSNPHSLRQIVDRMLASNPEMKERVDRDPNLRQMLMDPQRMSQLLNPGVIQQLREQSTRNDERTREMYRDQMNELVEQGFENDSANLAALVKTNGDVDEAIFVLAQQLADAEDE